MILLASALFVCTPVAVWDGDGPIWCAEGPRIRLAGIAAREIDESCRPRQPCPPAGGVAARDALVAMLGGARGMRPDGHVIVRAPAMRCRRVSIDAYGRTVAWCAAAGVGDLSCAMVRAKMAWRWRRYGGDKVCR